MEKNIQHSYNTRQSSKNKKKSNLKEEIVTKKSWNNSVGHPICDDPDDGDHPLWKVASIEEKMNLKTDISKD
tara:strand:- start:4601 stop:4816 length:216 start_codon:yes stop_codon:yes gene_type:complete